MKVYKFSVVYVDNNEDVDWSEMMGQILKGDLEVEEVHSPEDLPKGWNLDCIPFGDTNDNLREIFANQRGEPNIINLNGVRYKRID